jgi:hypothetical protein
MYIEALGCMTSWHLYGGSSTVFSKLVGDSLVEFARIKSFDGIREIARVYDDGTAEIIRTDSIPDSITFARYNNYDPIIKLKP